MYLYDFLDNIDIIECNNGHSIQSVLKNGKDMLICDDHLTNCICASLHFCKHCTKYYIRDYLANRINISIEQYKQGYVLPSYRSDFILYSPEHKYIPQQIQRLINGYGVYLFDLYNNYSKQTIEKRFNEICEYVGAKDVEFEDVLPSYGIAVSKSVQEEHTL